MIIINQVTATKADYGIGVIQELAFAIVWHDGNDLIKVVKMPLILS